MGGFLMVGERGGTILFNCFVEYVFSVSSGEMKGFWIIETSFSLLIFTKVSLSLS